MKKNKLENQTIHSFGVTRVSSDKQAQQGESLDEQRDSIQRYALNKGWANVHIFNFSLSGRTEMVELVKRITDFLEETPYPIKYCIFKKIDRITRAGTDGFSLIQNALLKYGVQIVDTYNVIQPDMNTLEHYGFEYDWSKFSPSDAATLIEVLRSKAETRDLLTRMIGQSIHLVQDGYRVRQAPDGYKNYSISNIMGKKKCVLIHDEERVDFFKKMFELRAQGSLSDTEIVDLINAEGYRSRVGTKWSKAGFKIGKTGSNKLSVKQFQRLITRPTYAGFNYEKWTHWKLIKGKYEGIVSIELFNRANRGKVFIKENNDATYELLHDYKIGKNLKQRNKDNPNFPFKFVRCDECQQSFLASSPKGKYGKGFPTYHCGVKQNKNRNHKYIGIPKDVFDKNVKDLLNALRFQDEYLEVFEKVLINKYREREEEVVKTSSNVNRNISDMQSEQATLINQIVNLESITTRKAFELKIENLENEIQKARLKRDEIEIRERDIKSYIKSAKYLMEHPSELLVSPYNFEQQRALLGLIFNDLPTYNQILNGTPKLSLIFKLSEEFKSSKSLCVTLRGIEPRLQE